MGTQKKETARADALAPISAVVIQGTGALQKALQGVSGVLSPACKVVIIALLALIVVCGLVHWVVA